MSDEPKQAKKTRTLIVKGFKQIGSFERNNVTNYIYEVTAVTPEGEMIGVPLRSFKDMTEYLEKPVEYEVKPHDSEKYGRTYTMLPPKKKVTEQVDELRAMIVTLQEQVAALQGRVFGGDQQGPAAASPPPPPVQPRQQRPAATGERFGDDPPF